MSQSVVRVLVVAAEGHVVYVTKQGEFCESRDTLTAQPVLGLLHGRYSKSKSRN